MFYFLRQNPECAFEALRLTAYASNDLGAPTCQSDNLLTHASSTAVSPFMENILELWTALAYNLISVCGFIVVQLTLFYSCSLTLFNDVSF